MIKPADRLSQFSEYYFSGKLREIRQLVAAGRPIINLGIGNPDLPPARQVTDALIAESKQADAHGYQPYQGLPALREAIRLFYQKRYNTNIDRLLTLPLAGSKEGITHVSLAYLNPGDEVLIPDPGYPTYTSVTQMTDANPVFYPLKEENGWEPDWSLLESTDTKRVKLMWINYPHMPTGSKGTYELLEKYVRYALERDILLCHDNPYSFIGNDNPHSIHTVRGAEKVVLEFGSLSKTFNMAGWRVGWVTGAEPLVKPVLQVKSNMDSGMFKAVQQAAVQALSLEDEWFDRINETYRSRRLVANRLLDKLGCDYTPGQAGMFVWAKVPKTNGKAFADMLLEKHDIFVAPGFIFGKEAGNRYIRVSLCASEKTLAEALNRLL